MRDGAALDGGNRTADDLGRSTKLYIFDLIFKSANSWGTGLSR